MKPPRSVISSAELDEGAGLPPHQPSTDQGRHTRVRAAAIEAEHVLVDVAPQVFCAHSVKSPADPIAEVPKDNLGDAANALPDASVARDDGGVSNLAPARDLPRARDPRQVRFAPARQTFDGKGNVRAYARVGGRNVAVWPWKRKRPAVALKQPKHLEVDDAAGADGLALREL
jgi:hypothetical protein